MMNNNQASSTVKQLREVPGVVACVLEHEVSKTKATIRWDGPKLNPIWAEILAFFKWTYDEHKSESQVRLYVNGRTKEWKAWAFPQEAKTGMSAREIDNDEAKAQRVQFNDQDGWLYFGTVHHHCSAGAFQSGTDENNERNQDGLHITVGKMDEKKHDLHCRLYVSGHKFEPDMSWFWDVEPMLAQVPAGLRKFLAMGMENTLARDQMCEPAPKDTAFPEQWKANVIEIKPAFTPTTYQGGIGYANRDDWGGEFRYLKSYKRPHNLDRDLWVANREFREYWEKEVGQGSPTDFLHQLIEGSDVIVELTEILYRNDVAIEKLHEKMESVDRALINKELKQEKNGKGKKGKKGKDDKEESQDNGVPDYCGPGGGAEWEGYGHGA